MAIALVAHVATPAGANGPLTSAGVDTTLSTLLVASITYAQSATVPTLSDFYGNTWVPLTAQVVGGSMGTQLYYVANPTVGAGHTFTLSGTGFTGVMLVQAFSGATATPFDVENGAASASATTIQTGSVTPSFAGSLLVTVMSSFNDTATRPTIDSGFTKTDDVVAAGGVNYSGTLAYLIQGAIAGVNPTWSLNFTSPTGATTTIAVFKSAAGTAGDSTASDLPPGSRPIPRMLSWIDPLKLNLRGKDTFFNGPGRGPVYDYPNPRGPIPAVALRTWIDQLKLTLRGRDVFPPNGAQDQQFPNPRAPVPAATLGTWIDPLKLALAGQDRFPPNGAQDQLFPNPFAPQRSIGLLTWTEPLKLSLNFVIAPFGQDDWPVPAGARYPSDLRTFLNPLDPQLQGQDFFFGVAGNPTEDWPVPKAPARSISLWTWADPLKLVLQSQDAFFGLAGSPQRDWPVPKGPIPGITLKTWVDPLKWALIGKDALPFGQDDWPNPGTARKPAPPWIDPAPLTLSFVVAPFGQDDWPNPKSLAGSTALRTWLDPLKIQLQVHGTGSALLLETADYFLLEGGGHLLLDPLSSLGPFVQGDWPNPKGRAPLLQDWTAAFPVNLAGRDKFFGLAGNPTHDWPNPRAPVRLLQPWIDQFKFSLNAIPVPFTQGNWPNPAGPVYAIALKTWVDPFKGAGTDTFYGLGGVPQFNWPNPVRAVVGIIPGIAPSTFYTSIIPPPPPPVPVDVSVPGPADGEDDESYAEVSRRKWLEWSRNRKRRSVVAPPSLQPEPPQLPQPVVPRPKRQLQDRDLLARNLERMRAGVLPGVLAPIVHGPAIQGPAIKEAVAKVVTELQKIADDDDDDTVAFLLGDDF